jgi:hypothetical protein
VPCTPNPGVPIRAATQPWANACLGAANTNAMANTATAQTRNTDAFIDSSLYP